MKEREEKKGKRKREREKGKEKKGKRKREREKGKEKKGKRRKKEKERRTRSLSQNPIRCESIKNFLVWIHNPWRLNAQCLGKPSIRC
ncbi:MAG: hypothetical protein QS99_C0013G0010 [archaeon GW2011_AR4]|nr:MAG: hypothetical protein QS99_C0013G0010 [archaeon GW2011_AR4]